VRRTTLEEVARAAGVTRGAIYWHFAARPELFYACASRCRCRRSTPGSPRRAPTPPIPWAAPNATCAGVVAALADPAARETFRIMTFKCEYVGELGRELDRPAQPLQRAHRQARSGLPACAARRPAASRADARPGASATCSFLIGLVRLWLMDRARGPVRRAAGAIIKLHIDSYRRNGR